MEINVCLCRAVCLFVSSISENHGKFRRNFAVILKVAQGQSYFISKLNFFRTKKFNLILSLFKLLDEFSIFFQNRRGSLQ